MIDYCKQLCLALLLVAPASYAEVPPPRILVSGEGVVQLAPDIALLNLTVTREAKTAREALDANNEAMSSVLEAMQKQGIAERDLQTSNFAIQPRYYHPPRPTNGERKAPHIVGYTVRNSLGVKVRDLEQVGKILDASVTLGVNEGGNLVFSNDDPSAAIARARVLAVADARTRAETIADAADVELGDILEISEQSHMPRPRPMMRAEMAMVASDSAAVPVATGENSYRVSVSMSYAIDQ